MSYKYSFADNESYSAEDINAITKRLVTSGVSDSFSDGVPYNVSKLNEAGQLLYTAGIVPESCLTLKVERSGEGKVTINPGIAFFEDGSVIEIEAGGEVLSYATGAKNYVYLKNDLLNTNTSYPCCTTDEPIGDYVLLAEIDETGMVSDKRTYAKGKLPGYQSVVGNVMRLKKTISITTETKTSNLSKSVSFDIGPNNFGYILVYRDFAEAPYNTQYPCLGIYDIANQKYRSFWATSRVVTGGVYARTFQATADEEKLILENNMHGSSYYTSSLSASVELDNDILTLTLHARKVNGTSHGYEIGTYSFDIDLILF